ncbi:hypothetical protein CJ030_MR8G004640 [Morella rubra]|uniref:Uncharacterized protein n=1 Tax=Morella rubra TaxID=262757 RepID=A0A6A1UZ08_9ROSI|nr:hypothetical protein CJ030_MR8G004640 [Morella rubra]
MKNLAGGSLAVDELKKSGGCVEGEEPKEHEAHQASSIFIARGGPDHFGRGRTRTFNGPSTSPRHPANIQRFNEAGLATARTRTGKYF